MESASFLGLWRFAVVFFAAGQAFPKSVERLIRLGISFVLFSPPRAPGGRWSW